jgi:hypothetical protein
MIIRGTGELIGELRFLRLELRFMIIDMIIADAAELRFFLL